MTSSAYVAPATTGVAAPARPPRTSARRQAALGGVLFLLTHVTSVGAVALYGPVVSADGLAGVEVDGTVVRLGVLLDVVLALAIVGTAVTLHPLLRRHGEGRATAYVGLRVLEAGVVLVGATAVLAFLSVLTSGDGGTAVGEALVATYRWAFLLGPGLVLPVSTVVLASLLHARRLVPRVVTVLGLVGGPLVAASNLAILFGVYGQTTPWALAAAVPVFAWEIGLALTLLVRGVPSAPDPETSHR